MARVLIEAHPSPGESVKLDEASSHHLLRVRRLARGAALVVVDGEGHEAPAVLSSVDGGLATLSITGEWTARTLVAPRHLVWAIPKGPALDLGLRMAVEAGVTHVHLALGRRSVARSDRRERWLRIIEGACVQCGRSERPSLDPLWPDLEAALSRVPEDAVRYRAHPRARSAMIEGARRAIAIGPEGGFAPEEIEQLDDQGWRLLSLGPHVLRSDTAAAVGVARLSQD